MVRAEAMTKGHDMMMVMVVSSWYGTSGVIMVAAGMGSATRAPAAPTREKHHLLSHIAPKLADPLPTVPVPANAPDAPPGHMSVLPQVGLGLAVTNQQQGRHGDGSGRHGRGGKGRQAVPLGAPEVGARSDRLDEVGVGRGCGS